MFKLHCITDLSFESTPVLDQSDNPKISPESLTLKNGQAELFSIFFLNSTSLTYLTVLG